MNIKYENDPSEMSSDFCILTSEIYIIYGQCASKPYKTGKFQYLQGPLVISYII